jgi:hypothetical protein
MAGRAPPRTATAARRLLAATAGLMTGRARAGEQVAGGQQGGGGRCLSPDRRLDMSQGRRSCDHPRKEENDLMGSMVPGVMEALVGRLSGRARGVTGRACQTPGESHETTPSGSATAR